MVSGEIGLLYRFSGDPVANRPEIIDGELKLHTSVDGQYGVFYSVADIPAYTGETEITPSEETQILLTADKLLRDNIVINPIPSNYGRITTIGNHIMVS